MKRPSAAAEEVVKPFSPLTNEEKKRIFENRLKTGRERARALKRPATKSSGSSPSKRDAGFSVPVVMAKPAAQETMGTPAASDDQHSAAMEGAEEETPWTSDPIVDPTFKKPATRTPMKKVAKTPSPKKQRSKKTRKPGSNSANFISEETNCHGWVIGTFKKGGNAPEGTVYYTYYKEGVGTFFSKTSAAKHGFTD